MKKLIYVSALAMGLLLTNACAKKADSQSADTKTDKPALEDKGPLFSYEENGMYGFKNGKGEVVIKAQYMQVEDTFSRKASIVMTEKGFSMINRKGELVLTPFLYDNGPDYVVEDLFRFVENGKMGFADLDGNKVIPATFEFVEPFSEGMAAICKDCKKVVDGEHYSMVGTWGYIDKTGKVVIEPMYTEAQPFEDGKASVKQKSTTKTIDKTGAIVK